MIALKATPVSRAAVGFRLPTLMKTMPSTEAMTESPQIRKGIQATRRPAAARRIDAGGRVVQARHEHAADEADRVGLEHVRGHAGAIADVITDVVGDGRRVAGIIFVEVLLDLADEVRADVRRLGVDAAAETGEDRDQARAERQTDEGV